MERTRQPHAAGRRADGGVLAVARRDDLLQQAAGPFPVLAASDLDGDEVGHAGLRERLDLRGNRVLVSDDRDVAGPAAPSLSSIAR